MNAEQLMLIAGISAFVVTLIWVRNREIREKYALWWVLISSCLLLLGIFPRTIMGLADAWKLSYPAMVLFVGLTLIYSFAFFVTVSLSRQYRRNMQLAQELALTRERLSKLEKSLAADGRNEHSSGNS